MHVSPFCLFWLVSSAMFVLAAKNGSSSLDICQSKRQSIDRIAKRVQPKRLKLPRIMEYGAVSGKSSRATDPKHQERTPDNRPGLLELPPMEKYWVRLSLATGLRRKMMTTNIRFLKLGQSSAAIGSQITVPSMKTMRTGCRWIRSVMMKNANLPVKCRQTAVWRSRFFLMHR